jgi:hypothetical protein
MSQNPYSNFGSSGSQYGGGPAVSGDFIDPTPSRTSVLAIVALVVSIVGCCSIIVPGPGAIAAMLGGLSVFFIARSRGRLTGTGIAVTAIVLGLFHTVALIALLVGASQVNSQVGKEFFVPMGQMMTAIEAGDSKGARAMLTPKASAAVTDEMLADFVKSYHASAGTFQKMPESVFETITMAMELGRASKSQRGGGGGTYNQHAGETTFPLPAKFSQGSALIMIAMDPTLMGQKQPGGAKQPTLLNLGVLTLDGKEVWLIDPDVARKLVSRPSGGSSAPSTSGNGSTPPTSTIEDAPDAKKTPEGSKPAPKPGH